LTSCDYIVGDSRKIESIIQKYDGKVNLVISSPPYFELKDYGSKKQIGLGQTYEAYLADVVNIFQKCYDLSSEDASFWMIVDTFKTEDKVVKTLPFDIVNQLTKTNNKTWQLKDVLIWNKVKNVPWHGRGHFKNHFEYILYFVKGADFKFNVNEIREISDMKKWWLTYPERYSPEGSGPSNVWDITTQIQGWGRYQFTHDCPFPFPLVERIISIASDKEDLVLDPFAGSGSVLAMALAMERNAVGIEINQKYQSEFERITGDAERYWNRRKGELTQIKKKLKQFKELNYYLRALKLSANISTTILDDCINIKNQIVAFVSFYDRASDNKLEIMVITKFEPHQIDWHNNDLNELIKQTKLNPSVCFTSLKTFKEQYGRESFYRYDIKKPYRFLDSIDIDGLMKKDDPTQFVLSNVGLKIEKPEDIEKKDLSSLMLHF